MQQIKTLDAPILILTAISFVSSLGIAVMLPLIPLYAVSLGASPLQLGSSQAPSRSRMQSPNLVPGCSPTASVPAASSAAASQRMRARTSSSRRRPPHRSSSPTGRSPAWGGSQPRFNTSLSGAGRGSSTYGLHERGPLRRLLYRAGRRSRLRWHRNRPRRSASALSARRPDQRNCLFRIVVSSPQGRADVAGWREALRRRIRALSQSPGRRLARRPVLPARGVRGFHHHVRAACDHRPRLVNTRGGRHLLRLLAPAASSWVRGCPIWPTASDAVSSPRSHASLSHYSVSALCWRSRVPCSTPSRSRQGVG